MYTQATTLALAVLLGGAEPLATQPEAPSTAPASQPASVHDFTMDDPDGRVIGRFGTRVPPRHPSLVGAVERALQRLPKATTQPHEAAR